MRGRPLIFLILLIVIFAVYWPVVTFPFLHWDDDRILLDNRLLNPVTMDNVVRVWTEIRSPADMLSPNYNPLFFTVCAALVWFSRNVISQDSVATMNPSVFHLANLALHILTTLLVFNILRMLLTAGFRNSGGRRDATDNPNRDYAAGIGAMLFALHPLQVQSVAWVTGLSTLLGAFFSFIAIREYIARTTCADKKNFHHIAGFTAFVLALLAKPNMVITPIVALIIGRWILKKPYGEIFRNLWPWFAAALLFTAVNVLAQPEIWIVHKTPLWSRPLIAGDILAFALYKLFLPFNLSADYGRSTAYLLQNRFIYFSWLAPAGFFAILYFRKERAAWLVPFGILVTGLLPVLGFIPYYLHSTATFTDRYLYLSMLGPALALSWLFMKISDSRIKTLCLLIPISLGGFSAVQALSWQSDIALFEQIVKVNRQSVIGHTNLGVILMSKGRLDDAEKHFAKSLKIRPDSPKAHNNLGMIFLNREKTGEAIEHFQKALAVQPNNRMFKANLQKALTAKGN